MLLSSDRCARFIGCAMMSATSLPQVCLKTGSTRPNSASGSFMNVRGATASSDFLSCDENEGRALFGALRSNEGFRPMRRGCSAHASHRHQPFSSNLSLLRCGQKRATFLIQVGNFELNRNPENVFAEVEQVAFSPANIVPASATHRTKNAAGASSPTEMRSVTA